MAEKALLHDFRKVVRFFGMGSGFVVFVAGYAAILFWFKEIDIYHNEFSTPGPLIAIYNLCRTVYIFYLFWIVYQVGNFLLTGLVRDSWRAVDGGDRLAIGFFAGTGICHAVLLLLGYLDLYTVPVAVLITLPLVIFAYRDAAVSFAALRLAFADLYARRTTRTWLLGVAVVIALAAATALLLVKGLYPAGGHDYFVHYFGYYKAVIDRGGIWPNEWWYHSYDSKGDGLVYLSMLLTDPLAPQLVSYCFIGAGALALHRLLTRLAPRTLWPLIGVTLYLSFLIYTPGLSVYQANGGWGDFEKWHELKVALMIAILWLVSGSFDAAVGNRAARMAAAGSAVVAAVLTDYTFAVYLGLFFALLSLAYLVRRRWREGSACIAFGAVTVAAFAVMLATNYMATGLFGDIGLVAWWRFTNIERLYQSGALFQAINDYWARSGLVTNTRPLIESAKAIFLSLRLELLLPFVASGFIVALAALISRRTPRLPPHQTIILTAAMLAYVAVALVFGRNDIQAISFYRYSSFTLPIVIAIGVALWSMADGFASAGRARAIALNFVAPAAVLAACWGTAYAAYPHGHFSPILRNAARFAIGRSSIDAAYTDQKQWPGRVPWGGIHPGARGAYAIVGPHVRVWLLNMHTYCMLPDCQFESFPAAAMTHDGDRIFFGTPEEAKHDLQKAGLNYFLFSSDLPITDPVVATPLFAPDTIAKYLGLRWTDGTTSLLTWLGPDTTPLGQTWLATYCPAVVRNIPSSFYYRAMRKVFAQLHARPHPWGSLDLPWAGNRPYEALSEDVPQFACPPFIEIVSATYGESCRGSRPKPTADDSLRDGNVTSYVQKICYRKDKRCSFLVDNVALGDPAPGCDKDFSVTYRCKPDEPTRTATVPASAIGRAVSLDCTVPPPDTSAHLDIRSATYGGNCGGKEGNATADMASTCNGRAQCAYAVNVERLGDPAPRCGKDFVASYSCNPAATVLRKSLRAEAGFGSILNLTCPPANGEPTRQ